MKIVLKKNYGKHVAGQQINLPDEIAEELMSENIALDIDTWEYTNAPDLSKCILKVEYGDKKAGDILECDWGVYETLIDNNRAIPIGDYDIITNRDSDIITNRDSEIKIQELLKQNTELQKEIEVLKQCKDLRTKPKNKKINDELVDRK